MVRLKEMRKEMGITQQQLADAIDVTRTAVVKYETGKNKPTAEVLGKLSDYFQVSVDYLLGRDMEEMKNDPAANADEVENVEAEFMKLFKRLSPEEQERELAYLRSRLNG